MTSRDIRRQFLDFFASKDHKIIPSAPIVAKSDPTLMFINSGMAPLKDFFLGNQVPPAKRVADTQKCLRVTGKHNDLEDVGRDGYHHTMFEMLGNWSFGDYFKKEAIAWSWELLTEVYKIPKDRLYVSVFKGDEKENLPFDQEAHDTWKLYIAEDRILPFGKKENFWEMGEQGPCGPCSEIHVDLRPDSERAQKDGRDLVNADDPNVIEVWNNVFMQFNRRADGSLDELPAKSVDTGMGFERLCRAVQGAASNYDTDLWKPLIGFLEKFSGIAYTGTYPDIHADWKKTDVAMRVVADHLRAVCFTIADGELPASGGAGYVIRRILRRAVRYYYSFLDLKEPVLYRMAPILAEEFHDVFPELKAQIDFVAKVVLEEEKTFLRTLESGLKRIEGLTIQNNTVDGQQAFELYDTFGFPIDLTRLIAREKGWSVDEAGFEKALQEQKIRSRKDAAKEVGDWISLPPAPSKGGGEAGGEVEFVGYDQLELHNSHVVKYRTVQVKGQPQYHLVLNRTPFYPEGGGQVGDTGWLEFSLPVGEGRGGVEKIRVLDTKKENDLVMHVVERLPQYIQDPTVHCQVDARKRRLTENNHSATHLLHAALRRVLGHHVQQKGSYLDDQTLRFDFAHFQKVSDDELAQIEQIVNEKIRENIALDEARSIPIEEAQKAGAMMLFGEKYGESVRMITFDPAYSRELCGGCHVRHTGQIGYFKIVSEGAVAAGVRRIEALTADAAEQYLATIEREVAAIKMLLKTKEPAKAVAELQEEQKRLQKNIDALYALRASRFVEELKGQYEEYENFNLLIQKVAIDDAKTIKTLAQNLEAAIKDAVIVLANEVEDKIQITIRISDVLVKERGMHAGKMVQEIAQKYLNGGGGGQPFFATGSGANKLGWASVYLAVKDLLKSEAQAIAPLASEITLPESDFSKNLLDKFALQPFKNHSTTPAWRHFTSKSHDFQRKVVLNQGRTDFTQPYRDSDLDLALYPSELVDLYCYYYMQMHYVSSLSMYTLRDETIRKNFLNNKDLLFLDIGCGPLTSGSAFVEYYNKLNLNETLRMFYVGFDIADEMLDRAQQVADEIKPKAGDSQFEFASEQLRVFELIEDFKHKFKQQERSAVIINLCYVLSAVWFDAEENLNAFADFILEINKRFEGHSVCIMFQNPDYTPLNRNWEKLKIKLSAFGKLHDRIGLIKFSFKDAVGSWKYPQPSLTTRMEWYFNETV